MHVPDGNPAPMVRDQSLLLKFACNGGYACPGHTHHLGKKFLGERQFCSDEIMHSSNPLTGALFDCMERIASGCLLYLTEKKLFVLHEQCKKTGRGLRDRSEVVCVHDARPTGHLNTNSMQRHFRR